MAELKELFEMVTNKVEPDLDAWQEQEKRRQQRQRRRRGGGFSVAAVLAAAAVIAAIALRNTSTREPLTSPTPAPLSSSTTLVAFDVATGEAVPLVKDVDAYGAAVSHDGSRIAFVQSVKGHAEVFIADIDGSGAEQVTGLPGQAGCGCGSFDPTWSPDDSQIAFTGTSAVGNRGIYVLTLATEHTRLLTHESGDSYETAPAWAPNGKQLVYATGSWQDEPAGSGEIFTRPVQGKRPPFLLLAQRPGATDPSWSPDGTQVVFAADVPGGTSLFVEDASTAAVSDPQRLGEGTDDGTPAWSPDGTQIAFTRGSEVAVLTLSTGEVRTLGAGGDPAWSPDGSTIYAWRA
jgi:Tol biopolymer transport system component